MIPGSGYHPYLVGPPVQYANTGIRNFGEFWWVRFAIRTTARMARLSQSLALQARPTTFLS